ncbi:MAG: hypothetical protein JWO40_190 [Candidatus Doudnabacteria bacterium]|nr:hypothetical protein [Candidatus Doudnabacteria bacterium]
MERFKFFVAVNLVLIKDGHVLLLRRENTGFEDGSYGLPSGHVDGRETVRQAMAREALEEVKVNIKPEDLEVFHTMHRLSSDREYIDFYLITEKWEGEPGIGEPLKCSDVSWFPLDQLPTNLISYLRPVMESYKNKVTFSEAGW